jgi:hypothetical protein
MLRYVWIGSMLTILSIVLYIPSVVPPERFLEVLRAEHALNRSILGAATSDRILKRMLDMQEQTQSVSTPPPSTVNIASQPAVDARMATQVTQMSTRLFANSYFRSIDTLFALATYRLSAFVENVPLLLVFLVIAAVDGFVVRAVRAREFVSQSAELFSASAMAAIVLFSAMVIAAFLPFSFHPTHVLAALLATLFIFSRAIANYHSVR